MTKKIICLCLMGLMPLSGVIFAGETDTHQTPSEVAKVAHIKGMDKAPVAVERVAPVYPMSLRERGIQGVATVEMRIDSTGRVVEAKAVRATLPEFAAQAEAAAAQWVFTPAEAAGKKITSRVMVPFEFTMPEIAALEAR